ncbi:hypothetical protein [Candidatus Leptofilum sp.]|uniref:hypothetical protein n=1 Tax=Candidatus Leptofilum sp. TaxID=3241576 RepID=UPI003B5B4E21
MLRKIRDFFRRKPATPPITEGVLAVKFANFFINYAQNLPPDQEYETVGWGEDQRERMFQKSSHLHYKEKREFETKCCKIFQLDYRTVEAILAHCANNDEILWLDNHLNNQDFEKFLLLEEFLKRLPTQPTEFATLFTKLKLSYLGRPKLISKASQIAPSKERYEKLWSYSEAWQEKLLADAKLIEELDTRIFLPRCIQAREGYSLTFFVWTKILGRLFQVECEINHSGAVQYSLTLLVNGIGDAFTPR